MLTGSFLRTTATPRPQVLGRGVFAHGKALVDQSRPDRIPVNPAAVLAGGETTLPVREVRNDSQDTKTSSARGLQRNDSPVGKLEPKPRAVLKLGPAERGEEGQRGPFAHGRLAGARRHDFNHPTGRYVN